MKTFFFFYGKYRQYTFFQSYHFIDQAQVFHTKLQESQVSMQGSITFFQITSIRHPAGKKNKNKQ